MCGGIKTVVHWPIIPEKRWHMFENNQASPVESAINIRIVGINTDKTRRMIGSEQVYQVYFELSGAPPQGWRTIFEQEWKSINAGQPLALQASSVERSFLMVHCPLQEIVNHLPALKKAVAATNIAYEQYAQKQASDEKDRENAWKDERKTVEDVAKSLQFD